MKIKVIFLISYFCVSAGISLAQENRLKYIGIETGLTFMDSEMSNMDFIRGDIPAYYGGYSTNSLTSLSYKSFIGIKPEILSLNDRFGLFAGLRFSRVNNTVGKNDYWWTSSTDYFYWLYRQDGVNTEYLKVKRINQRSDYIGIPMEIRYFPARRPHMVRVYIKFGAEIDYLLKTKTNIVFKDNAMNLYQNDLISKLEQPKRLSSSVYGGVGIRIGKELKPSVSIEACPLNLYLTSRSSGLLYPIYGGGFQLNFQIPIK